MITWLLGRSGTGKTETLMKKLPQLAAQYKQVWYLVPEQSSMGLERELGALHLGNVKAVSFRRLSNEIFRRFGGVAGSYMTATRQTALIYRVLQEQQTNLRYYRRVRPTMGFVARLSEAFSEFSLSGLRYEAVQPVVAKSGRADWQEKYHDLFLLYESYCAALDAENRSAAEDLAAATALAREGGFFKDAAVLIDGFFGFTGRQRELLQVLFEQSEQVTCALLLDTAEGSLLFRTAQNEWEALKRLAGSREQQTVRLENPSYRLQHEDLQFLERHFFATREPEAMEAKHLRLMVGRNVREELSMVAADIAKKVREQGLRYRDFALLAGSLEEYGPIAETVFAKYGVPLFVDRGRSSLGKPIFAFVQSALRLISPERYFRQEDLLILLKTGLCGEDRDLISRFENYCTMWQMNGERLIRDEDWTQNPAGLGKLDEKGEALLKELNGLRQRLRAPLLRFKERAARGTGKALAEAIYGLLTDFEVEKQIAEIAEGYLAQSTAGENAWETQQNRRLSREYLKLYGVMTDILDDIYLVFGDAPLSLYAMEELIGLCGEETALNVTPPTLDAVSMGEVAHSRLQDVHALYVVGANQGILPMPVGDNGLIGDGERRLFAAHDLPCNATLQQNTLQGQYRLYAALFCAREELTFTYSAFSMSGEALLPSVYVDKLRRLTELNPILRSEMELYDFALTREGARELTGWEPALREEILAELGEKPLPPRDPADRLPEEVVRRIFGDRLRLSYSQISLYQDCPFRYFLEKTMGIRELQPITFDAPNIGTFVHYGMEKLVKALREENFNYDLYTPERIQQFGEVLAEEYLGDQLRDFNRTNRFRSLYRRMTSLFCLVAENVLGELREGQYVPYGEEVSLEGVRLPLKNGATAELIGSVDRVDTYEKDGKTYLKVTDYKTGSRKFDLKGITNRDGVQLPIYLYGLMNSGRWETPVPGAACYMEAKTPVLKTAFDAGELEEKLRDFYKRNGAYNGEEASLSALDGAGGSRYFGIRYLKSGGLHSGETKVYEPQLMQELVEHMERVIRETAEEILSGEASVRPLKGGGHDACTYCSLKATCGHVEGCGERRYKEDPMGWREAHE